jgi:hypothetical protein
MASRCCPRRRGAPVVFGPAHPCLDKAPLSTFIHPPLSHLRRKTPKGKFSQSQGSLRCLRTVCFVCSDLRSVWMWCLPARLRDRGVPQHGQAL